MNYLLMKRVGRGEVESTLGVWVRLVKQWNKRKLTVESRHRFSSSRGFYLPPLFFFVFFFRRRERAGGREGERERDAVPTEACHTEQQ